MANQPKISTSTGLTALLFCLSALLLGYTSYLMHSNQALDVQAMALSPSWYYINPVFIEAVIVRGGFWGTLCAVVLNSFNAVLWAALSFAGCYLLFGHLFRPSNKSVSSSERQKPLANGESKAEILGSELMVMLPTYNNDGAEVERGGAIDLNPYRQVFYRIAKKVPAVAPGTHMNAYRKLYLAIYSMLNAHQNVPASVGGHHADTDLFEHSLAVSKKVQAFYTDKGKSEPLASVAGLAHDLDKLLAYKLKGDTWVKNVNATHHNKFAAYIVSTQIEFRELPEDDQNVLLLALRYYHDPENLPIGATHRVEYLIRALRSADGFAIQAEKAAGIESIEDESLTIIDSALIATIKELNINGYLSSDEHAGGWTSPALEYVLIPMSTVIEKLGKHLTVELVRKLQLDHETRTFRHPAARLLRDRLSQMNLLMTSYKNFVTESGLFNCRIGNTRFSAVLMLEKRTLSPLLPGLLEKWDNSPYRIRILGGTEDNTVQGDSDVDETNKEA